MKFRSARLLWLLRNVRFELLNMIISNLGKCQAVGGLMYLERCYTVAVLTTGKYMDIDEAADKCNETGGMLGEIYSIDHETALQTFIRPLVPSSKNFLYVWIGMKYQPSVRLRQASCFYRLVQNLYKLHHIQNANVLLEVKLLTNQ